MHADVDAVVVAWLDRQPPESIWTTSTAIFEVRFGLELLASGRRRRSLEVAVDRVLTEDFEDRVVPFDEAAAQSAGRIAAERRKLGRPVDVRDVQIAGIAAARHATIATRNVRHFEGLGTAIVDPWSA